MSERRSELFLRIALLAALGLRLAGAVSCRRGEVSSGAPVVVISIDTLRADHLPAYGYSRLVRNVPTPFGYRAAAETLRVLGDQAGTRELERRALQRSRSVSSGSGAPRAAAVSARASS